MIEQMFDSGSMPVLERLVQFSSMRHKYITTNIANVSTPNYKPMDLSVSGFQEVLGKAIDARRARNGGPTGKLNVKDSTDFNFGPDSIQAKAQGMNDNILFHDQNNRSVEHLMKDLAENTLAHNAALEMLRSQFMVLESAIKGRV